MGHGKGKVTGRDVAKMGGMTEMIAALVKRIAEGNSEIKETSVAALKNIATQNHGEHTEALYKAGGVKPLVNLLVNGSADAQHNSCGALAAIANGKPDVQVAIVEGGGVPPIVKLLRMGGAAVQEQVGPASERRRPRVIGTRHARTHTNARAHTLSTCAYTHNKLRLRTLSSPTIFAPPPVHPSRHSAGGRGAGGAVA